MERKNDITRFDNAVYFKHAETQQPVLVAVYLASAFGFHHVYHAEPDFTGHCLGQMINFTLKNMTSYTVVPKSYPV